MPKRMSQAAAAIAAPPPPRFTRMTRNNQVTIPKPLTDPRGVGTGSLFKVESLPDGFFLKIVTVEPDPDRQAYLNAKAGVGLSPVFNTADAFLADLHKKTGRKPAAVVRSKRKK